MNVVLGYTKIYYFYFPLPNKKIYILQVTIKSLKPSSHEIGILKKLLKSNSPKTNYFKLK